MSNILIDVKQEILDKTGVDLNSDLSKIPDDKLINAFKTAKFLDLYYASISVTEKTFMNSIYGATGTVHFEFANFDVAEDICLEGRFYIKMGQNVANHYLQNMWHLDIEMHDHLKQKFPGEFTKDFGTQLENIDYVVYIDTDSIYVEFDQLVESVGFTGKIPYLIIAINDFRLKGLFAKVLGATVEKRFGENYLKFDLESISAVGFFLAKKKYLLAYSWLDYLDDVIAEPHHHLKGKGIEIARRELSHMVIKLIKYVLSEIVNETLTRDNYKAYMKSAYSLFMNKKIHIAQFCKYVNLNKTEKYIAHADENGWATNKRALPQHKGSARFNHLIAKHKLEDRYHKLNDSTKVGSYLDTNGQWFSFELGDFPHEIAPDMDRLAMFHKLVLVPVTRFAVLAGYDVTDPLSDTTQCSI